jgi:hypothetical protein
MTDLGFIILRHVNSATTNKYWKHCYKCIRHHYPENKILIVDDNSNYKYITGMVLYKTRIIRSEYPGRGELLPYFYYLHNKEFDSALIIHDSVFMKYKVDLSVKKYKMLWHFEHDWDQIADETKMINNLNNPELKRFYENKNLWNGCFGCMSVITHDYLVFINNKYDISKLLNCVQTRYNRCSLERVLACLLQSSEGSTPSLFGNIMGYGHWGIKWKDKNNHDLPFVKVWTGR